MPGRWVLRVKEASRTQIPILSVRHFTGQPWNSADVGNDRGRTKTPRDGYQPGACFLLETTG